MKNIKDNIIKKVGPSIYSSIKYNICGAIKPKLLCSALRRNLRDNIRNGIRNVTERDIKITETILEVKLLIESQIKILVNEAT